MREPGTQDAGEGLKNEAEAGVKGAFEIAGADHPDTVEVSHAEFCRGLPAGHFRLIVNPDKARKFVRHRLFLIAITLPMAGLGAAAALSGYPWAGLCMVVAAVALNRLVTYQAPKILLHLATQDERTYREAIEFEILEVRRAR